MATALWFGNGLATTQGCASTLPDHPRAGQCLALFLYPNDGRCFDTSPIPTSGEKIR
jgi:hypothetical protein